MDPDTDTPPSATATDERPEPFASLRKRNERHWRAAKRLEVERERHIDRVVQAQRARRIDQPR